MPIFYVTIYVSYWVFRLKFFNLLTIMLKIRPGKNSLGGSILTRIKKMRAATYNTSPSSPVNHPPSTEFLTTAKNVISQILTSKIRYDYVMPVYYDPWNMGNVFEVTLHI